MPFFPVSTQMHSEVQIQTAFFTRTQVFNQTTCKSLAHSILQIHILQFYPPLSWFSPILHLFYILKSKHFYTCKHFLQWYIYIFHYHSKQHTARTNFCTFFTYLITKKHACHHILFQLKTAAFQHHPIHHIPAQQNSSKYIFILKNFITLIFFKYYVENKNDKQLSFFPIFYINTNKIIFYHANTHFFVQNKYFGLLFFLTSKSAPHKIRLSHWLIITSFI